MEAAGILAASDAMAAGNPEKELRELAQAFPNVKGSEWMMARGGRD